MKYLLINLSDIENSHIPKHTVEQHAHFVDFIMNNYYISAGNKHCTWFALNFPHAVYVDIIIEVI
jgi:hypothetical protein